MNLSPHFTLEEAIASATASLHCANNMPPASVQVTMRQAAMDMEAVRTILGHPITVSSWYRSPILNALVGSKSTSQHVQGEAIDFECPSFGVPVSICKEIIKYPDLVDFDQLILEHGWVHISFAILSGKPRRQVLSLLTSGHYAPGLTNAHGIPYN